MNSLSSRLESLPLSPEQIAEAADVHLTTAYRWFAGTRTPRDKSLKRIAEATGVNLHWLQTGDGEMGPGQSDGGNGSPPSPPPLPEPDTVPEKKPSDRVAGRGPAPGRVAVRVPYYGRVGAGPPRVPPEAVGYFDVSEAEYASDFKASPRRGAGGLVADGPFGYFSVDGDSAAPVFFDGERVPVEVLPTPTDVFAQDSVCVFLWDDGHMLKRLRRHPGGRIEAMSLSPGIPSFWFHPGEDSEQFAVLAVARVSEKQQLYTSLVHTLYRVDS